VTVSELTIAGLQQSLRPLADSHCVRSCDKFMIGSGAVPCSKCGLSAPSEDSGQCP